MTHLAAILTLLPALFFPIHAALGQWTPINGPNGGDVTWVRAVDSRLVALAGITYVSTDHGEQWTEDPSALSPAPPWVGPYDVPGGRLLLGTSDGLFSSTDGGQTWTSEPLHTPIFSIAVSPSRCYLGTQGGVLMSIDSGKTWTDITYPPLFGPILSLLVVDSLVYAGNQEGLFLTSDDGFSWQDISAGFARNHVSKLLAQGPRVFAGTDAGLFVSTDHGAHWLPQEGVTPRQWVRELVRIGASLFSSSDSLYRSDDGGVHWATVNQGLPSGTFVNSLCDDGAMVVAGTDRGVYRAPYANGGWVEMNEGLVEAATRALVEYRGRLFAALEPSGLAVSSDRGAHWHIVPVLPAHGLSLALVPSVSDGDSVLVFGGVGCFRSTDAGVTWTAADSGRSGNAVFVLTAVDTVLYMGTDYYLFRSTDRGISWNPCTHGDDCTAIAAHKNTVYVGWHSSGVTRSTDGGLTWTDVSIGLPPARPGYSSINGIALSGSSVIVGTENGLYRSTDEGRHWSAAGAQLDFPSSPFAVSDSLTCASLWVSSAQHPAFALSSDGGLSWRKLAMEMQERPRGFAKDGEYLYALPSRGRIWRTPLASLVTTVPFQGSGAQPEIRLDQNFPNPFNPRTTIRFSLPHGAMVQLVVFDLLGREVRRLLDQWCPGGLHSTAFDATNLPSGIYIYTLTLDGISRSRGMTLVR